MSSLGDYLRARRDQVQPGDVGLPEHGVRRVPGLRREEVATLAGISADYYLRLEQGRDHNPSVHVLEAIARVLLLDDAATAHLMALGSPQRRRTRAPRREVVPASTRLLLESLGVPAFVEGRYLDILAANRLATALSPNLVAGRNRLRDIFLDPAERSFWCDWEGTTAAFVGVVRDALGSNVDDPRAVELVGDLSLRSDRFRALWARHDVRECAPGESRLRHPDLGELTVLREKLEVRGTDGQLLVIYHAAAGTPDGDALALLGSLAATPPGQPVLPAAAVQTWPTSTT